MRAGSLLNASSQVMGYGAISQEFAPRNAPNADACLVLLLAIIRGLEKLMLIY